jgi:penicillin G amidase
VLSRVVRIANLSVALLLVLIAFTVYWYAFRPLPKTSGEITAPVSKSAIVKRDERGVPHIEASSWQDAIFLQGYVTAQDRLWQMDVLRRFAKGELSEVFGPDALKADQEARRMRMRQISEEQAAHLRPSDRAVMVAFARGVNYFIDTHRDHYSLEFSLPGRRYDPRPWTLSDSLAVGLVMFRDLSDTAKFEFDKGALLQTSRDPAKMKTLFPASQGQYVSPGSNAWAVSGSHTVDGKPLVANDPHLSYGIPPTWYLIHLKAPDLNVSGASLPGVPCIITGHNNHIAWGVTNVQADVMDLYQERLDQRTGRYLFQGQVEQALLDRQMIGVKDRKAEPLDIWVTRHGPVVMTIGDRSFTMRWAATEKFAFPFFDVDRAGNWSEFRTALHDFAGPGQNFVYADRDGNIGYQATGLLPIRRGFDGDVPLDGTTGRAEWDRFIPFEQLPSIFNPTEGIIATANQNPFPPDFPFTVNGSYHDRYRIRQISAMLRAKPKLSVPDMLAIQKDVYAAYDSYLAHEVLAAASRSSSSDPLVNEALTVLRGWNGQMDKDLAAPVITQLLSARLATSLVESLLPAALQQEMEKQVVTQLAQRRAGGSSALPSILPRPSVIEDLLRAKPQGWVPANDWNAWLLKNFSSALQSGRRLQGSPVSKWRWGQILQWTFSHPLGSHLPLVSTYFDIGPIPMSGSSNTVKQTTATLGPSERMVVDVGNWDQSVQNLTTGESGFVASSHYKDEWDAYYVGKSFPMEFDMVKAKETLTIRPVQ